MTLFAGTTVPADIRIGTAPVQAIYAGSVLIWNRTPLSVSVVPPFVSGSDMTGSVSASAVGGSGSYTWHWQRVSGSLAIHPTAPTSPMTAFERLSAQPATGTWRCRVDDGSQVAFSPNIAVSLTGDNNGIVPEDDDIPEDDDFIPTPPTQPPEEAL